MSKSQLNKKDLGFKADPKNVYVSSMRIEQEQGMFIGRVAQNFFNGNWTAARRYILKFAQENENLLVERVKELNDTTHISVEIPIKWRKELTKISILLSEETEKNVTFSELIKNAIGAEYGLDKKKDYNEDGEEIK